MQKQLKQSETDNTETQAPTTTRGQKINQLIHRTGVVAAKTAVGVGVGAVAGIGAVVAIAAAEVTLPALVVLKAFGFAGGAIGFLSGLKK